MIICRTKSDLKTALRAHYEQSHAIGFVPTMGFLHEGHASLMRSARSENDVVVLSIFVNPMQFGPNEDLDRYPRDEKRDLALAETCGVDIVFLPSVEEMYPTKPLTSIIVHEVSERLCGASRPGHFDGVGLVVSKLFHLVKPTRAYFGMKDAQQVAVIEQMVKDLDFDLQIVPCPIIREPDGLALSSRNVYLSPSQRLEAGVLNQSLIKVEELSPEEFENLTASSLKQLISDWITNGSSGVIDYVEILPYPSLQPFPENQLLTQLQQQKIIIALAVKFGTTRLIDNSLYEMGEVMQRV